MESVFAFRGEVQVEEDEDVDHYRGSEPLDAALALAMAHNERCSLSSGDQEIVLAAEEQTLTYPFTLTDFSLAEEGRSSARDEAPEYQAYDEKALRRHLYRLWLSVPEWPRMPLSQSTLVAEDMAQWDAQAAQRPGVGLVSTA